VESLRHLEQYFYKTPIHQLDLNPSEAVESGSSACMKPCAYGMKLSTFTICMKLSVHGILTRFFVEYFVLIECYRLHLLIH
jgi:hypothetical protein